MFELLIHQFKEKKRSHFWQKSITLNIVLGILGLYMLLNMLAIGYFADKIIGEIYKEVNLVVAFSGILFYYFALELIFRFLFQQLPTLSIQPYLTLPIKKSKLLHYPLIKSTFSFFNLLALLLIVPFFVKIVCTTNPVWFCLIWIVTVIALIATNNFLNYSLKKYFSKRPVIILLLLGLVGLMLYFDISKTISISSYFSKSFLYLCENPRWVVVPIAISALSYCLAYTLLKNNSYLEYNQNNKRNTIDAFSFLGRFGEIGNLIRFEIKMILRNKRPKSMLYLCVIFMLYGFLFYQKESLNNYLILIFCGFILTSGLSISYGQYSFSWESSFFDTFLVNKISPVTYIKSKYLFLSMSCFLTFIITLPYCLIDYKIGLINAAMLLYNIGINTLMMLFFCTFNSSRIDLGRSQFMNYQGMGISQFLLVFPTMAIPAIAYIVFNSIGFPQFSFYFLGVLGIIGIIFSKYLIQLVASQFVKRRYKMAVGFRQK